MTRTSCDLKRFVIVVLLLLSGLVITTQRPAEASMNPPLVPLMLAGVSGTHTVYVVSTSNLFDSSHPSACGFGCYLLERTTDGGAHFKVLDLPRTSYLNDSLTGTLDQLVFANTSDGYALMGAGAPRSLYVTLNGGGSWHRENIASGTEILRFAATTSHVVAVVARCGSATPCTDFRLATSPLPADHWTLSPLANWPVGMGVGLGAFGSTIWLTQQTHSTVKLMTSHNLGVTFTERSAPRLGSVYACYMTATSDASLWAECPTGMASSFFYSSTGGLTWNIIPVRQFSNTGGGFFEPVSSSLAFLALGRSDSLGARNFYDVTNQGRSLTPAGKLPCNIVNGLVFTDPTHGFAACDELNSFASTILLKTSNGGATWSPATSFYSPI